MTGNKWNSQRKTSFVWRGINKYFVPRCVLFIGGATCCHGHGESSQNMYMLSAGHHFPLLYRFSPCFHSLYVHVWVHGRVDTYTHTPAYASVWFCYLDRFNLACIVLFCLEKDSLPEVDCTPDWWRTSSQAALLYDYNTDFSSTLGHNSYRKESSLPVLLISDGFVLTWCNGFLPFVLNNVASEQPLSSWTSHARGASCLEAERWKTKPKNMIRKWPRALLCGCFHIYCRVVFIKHH